MEAEMVAIGLAAMEVIWLCKFFNDINMPLCVPVNVLSDSQGAVARILNPVFSESTKHIDVKWAISKEAIERGEMKLSFTPGSENVADILTKALDGEKTNFCRNGMGVKDVRPYQPKDK
jgi:hypothetical protein